MKSGAKDGNRANKRLLTLLVDDRDWYRIFIARALNVENEFSFIQASDGLAALQILHERGLEIDLIISDERMSGMSGTFLLNTAEKRWPHIKRVLLTAYAFADLRERASMLVLDKSWTTEILRREILAFVRGKS